jgi:hypothetical protein
VIKARKSTIANCELEIERLEHSVGALQKEKVTAENRIKNLEEAFEWIALDKQYVNPRFFFVVGVERELILVCLKIVCLGRRIRSMILVVLMLTS